MPAATTCPTPRKRMTLACALDARDPASCSRSTVLRHRRPVQRLPSRQHRLSSSRDMLTIREVNADIHGPLPLAPSTSDIKHILSLIRDRQRKKEFLCCDSRIKGTKCAGFCGISTHIFLSGEGTYPSQRRYWAVRKLKSSMRHFMSASTPSSWHMRYH